MTSSTDRRKRPTLGRAPPGCAPDHLIATVADRPGMPRRVTPLADATSGGPKRLGRASRSATCCPRSRKVRETPGRASALTSSVAMTLVGRQAAGRGAKRIRNTTTSAPSRLALKPGRGGATTRPLTFSQPRPEDVRRRLGGGGVRITAPLGVVILFEPGPRGPGRAGWAPPADDARGGPGLRDAVELVRPAFFSTCGLEFREGTSSSAHPPTQHPRTSIKTTR